MGPTAGRPGQPNAKSPERQGKPSQRGGVLLQLQLIGAKGKSAGDQRGKDICSVQPASGLPPGLFRRQIRDRVLARIEDQPRRATFSRTLSRQLTERPKKEGSMRQGRLHWRSATRGWGSSGDQPEKETPNRTHLRQSQDQHKKGKSSAVRTCPPPRRFTPTMRPTKFSKRIGQESCLTWTLG